VRGYVSCVLGCPYEGAVAPAGGAGGERALLDWAATRYPSATRSAWAPPARWPPARTLLVPELGTDRLALHCHDTYGQALANILIGLQLGIARIDSAVAGLGGCPYAAGASGNVATEDVVYMLQGMGIDTGVDLDALIAVGERCLRQALGAPTSRVRVAQGTYRR
jgi:hydroxymethylglutaryl-CoA lyase